MPTYVFLVNMTEKGKSNLEEATKASGEINDLVKKLGGTIKDAFMTLGRYDAVEIIELPDDQAALKLSMKSSSLGYVKLETLRAFNEKELDSLMKV